MTKWIFFLIYSPLSQKNSPTLSVHLQELLEYCCVKDFFIKLNHLMLFKLPYLVLHIGQIIEKTFVKSALNAYI